MSLGLTKTAGRRGDSPVAQALSPVWVSGNVREPSHLKVHSHNPRFEHIYNIDIQYTETTQKNTNQRSTPSTYDISHNKRKMMFEIHIYIYIYTVYIIIIIISWRYIKDTHHTQKIPMAPPKSKMGRCLANSPLATRNTKALRVTLSSPWAQMAGWHIMPSRLHPNALKMTMNKFIPIPRQQIQNSLKS